MSYQLKTKHVLLALLFVITGTFLLGWQYGHTKEKDRLSAIITAKDDKIDRLTMEIDNQLNYVVKIEQELVKQKKALREGEITREELKKLNLRQANEITRLKLQIDTLLKNIIYDGQIVEILNSQIANYKEVTDSIKKRKAILLPFAFPKEPQVDKWLYLKGTFDNEGVLDMTLRMAMDVDIWTGVEKKTGKPRAIVTTTNPYVGVINVTSQKFDAPKPKTFSFGVQLGYGLILSDKPGLSPYVGLGISRNLFSL